MSRLIKHHAAVAASAAVITASPPEPPPEAALLDLAQEQIAALEAQLQAVQAQHQHALEAAQARGREAALQAQQQAVDAHAASERARLEVLTESMEAARQAFDARLCKGAEALALALTQVALERVLGEAHAYRDLVTATIGGRLQTLREREILRCRVAAVDFEGAALPQVPGAVIETCSSLPAGACVLDLAAGGELDLSIPAQHARTVAYVQALAHG